jgi:hypothetical protein
MADKIGGPFATTYEKISEEIEFGDLEGISYRI